MSKLEILNPLLGKTILSILFDDSQCNEALEIETTDGLVFKIESSRGGRILLFTQIEKHESSEN